MTGFPFMAGWSALDFQCEYDDRVRGQGAVRRDTHRDVNGTLALAEVQAVLAVAISWVIFLEALTLNK